MIYAGARETIFSEDRRYRYVLWREWEPLLSEQPSYVMFIGLNPSTADEESDDPTIRKCIGFTKRWGHDALCMTNLFAYCATNPSMMKKQPDPIGLDNNDWLLALAKDAARIIACWGLHGRFLLRDNEVLRMIKATGRRVECLRVTGSGHPEHPLYVPYDVTPVPL